MVLEADRPHVAQELLSAGAELAAAIDGHVVALAEAGEADARRLGAWGADEVVMLVGSPAPAEDVARAVVEWAEQASPWAMLAPSTAWGREVAGRAAARLGAGLTGEIDFHHVGRLEERLDESAGRDQHAIRAQTHRQISVPARNQSLRRELPAAQRHAPGHRTRVHSSWTIVPATMVRTARPVSARPVNGVLRLLE